MSTEDLTKIASNMNFWVAQEVERRLEEYIATLTSQEIMEKVRNQQLDISGLRHEFKTLQSGAHREHTELLAAREVVKAAKEVEKFCDFTSFGGEAQDCFGELLDAVEEYDKVVRGEK